MLPRRVNIGPIHIGVLCFNGFLRFDIAIALCVHIIFKDPVQEGPPPHALHRRGHSGLQVIAGDIQEEERLKIRTSMPILIDAKTIDCSCST